MKLAMVQGKDWGSMAQNLERSISAIGKAAAQNADLVLFPEMNLNEFFPQYPGRNVTHYGLTLDAPEVTALRSACQRHGIMAVPNFYLRENGRYYDASVLIDRDGTILGVQKMVHVAQAEQFYEQDYYTPSDDGFHVFDTPLGRLGVVVCYDRHYPESIRTEALMEADLILIPTANTHREPMELFDWEIRVQAFHNSVPIAMCNRVGTEGDMVFSGESLAVDAGGALLCKADHREQLVFVDIPLRTRPSAYTALRRPELYR